MSNRIRISCINRSTRSEPWSRITDVGGQNPTGSRWKLTQSEAISRIVNGVYVFYIEDGGREIEVIVARHEGRRYLKTERDNFHPQSLLALPECP